jgi:hypothetical protein
VAVFWKWVSRDVIVPWIIITNIYLVCIYTVKLDYSNIGFCDTLSIASNIQWYELIPREATVLIPCLVRHAQMHQPRI